MAGENVVETTPDLSTYTKVYYSESATGANKVQVAYVKEIPQLEESPEQITEQVLDLGYELAQPGIKKAGKVEIPILFTHTQHKSLKAINNTEKYWFFELPSNTAETANTPLVRRVKAKSVLIMDTITVGEFLKDILNLYKTSDVTESDGFPSA